MWDFLTYHPSWGDICKVAFVVFCLREIYYALSECAYNHIDHCEKCQRRMGLYDLDRE